MQFGLVSTKDQYAVELAIYNMAAYMTNIKRWVADLKGKKSDADILVHKRIPPYGIPIDLLLLKDLKLRMLQGLPIDPVVARRFLLVVHRP